MLGQQGYDRRTHFPFLLKQLAPGQTSGTFSQSIMDRVIALRDRMKLKIHAGGRMQMDWLEVRIAIFDRYHRRISGEVSINIGRRQEPGLQQLIMLPGLPPS